MVITIIYLHIPLKPSAAYFGPYVMSKVSFNEDSTLTIRVTFLVQTALQPMTALMENSVLAGGYFLREGGPDLAVEGDLVGFHLQKNLVGNGLRHFYALWRLQAPALRF